MPILILNIVIILAMYRLVCKVPTLFLINVRYNNWRDVLYQLYTYTCKFWGFFFNSKFFVCKVYTTIIVFTPAKMAMSRNEFYSNTFKK